MHKPTVTHSNSGTGLPSVDKWERYSEQSINGKNRKEKKKCDCEKTHIIAPSEYLILVILKDYIMADSFIFIISRA